MTAGLATCSHGWRIIKRGVLALRPPFFSPSPGAGACPPPGRPFRWPRCHAPPPVDPYRLVVPAARARSPLYRSFLWPPSLRPHPRPHRPLLWPPSLRPHRHRHAPATRPADRHPQPCFRTRPSTRTALPCSRTPVSPYARPTDSLSCRWHTPDRPIRSAAACAHPSSRPAVRSPGTRHRPVPASVPCGSFEHPSPSRPRPSRYTNPPYFILPLARPPSS